MSLVEAFSASSYKISVAIRLLHCLTAPMLQTSAFFYPILSIFQPICASFFSFIDLDIFSFIQFASISVFSTNVFGIGFSSFYVLQTF